MENIKLPSASEAEDVLLGAILQDASIYDSVLNYINEEVLYKETSKILWHKICGMVKGGYHVDTITVAQKLTEGEKSAGLSAYYLTGLFQYAVGKDLAVTYAKAIHEKYILRLIIEKSSKLQSLARENHADAYNTLTETHSLIGELIQIRPGENFNIDECMLDVMSSIEQGEGSLIRTGFTGLDELAGGMTRGEITIVGGRPGHGKTTFTINLIKSLVENNQKVILFNREMTNVEMMKKLIALESGSLSYGMIRRGVFDMEALAELERVKKFIINKYSDDKFSQFDNLKILAQVPLKLKNLSLIL